MASLTRRRLLAGGAVAAGTLPILHSTIPHSHPWEHEAQAAEGGAHAGTALACARRARRFRDGRTVDHAANGFDPHELLRDFDWGTTRRPRAGASCASGRSSRSTSEIEVAPGVTFAAWTYNGRIPGPTLRCREGERLRITFYNGSAHPHTIHFHGIHPAEMDGVPGLGAGQIAPGGQTVYEFDALPAGLHLYHCHVRPLAEHIAKGLYGAFIIDPKDGREEADELVMVMNGFDTNFDRANELYAANTIGFAYMHHADRRAARRARAALPRQRARVRPDQLVPPARQPLRLLPDRHRLDAERAHRHGDAVPGPARDPRDGASRTPGSYMFHAHQSEFTELGWQGFFEVSG